MIQNPLILQFASTGLGSRAAASEEAGPGPTSYWKFDEGQGQTIHDNTANGNDGTLGTDSSTAVDDPNWVADDQCVSGTCLFFDGNTKNVTTVDTPFDLGTSSFTLSAWAKLESSASGEYDIIDKQSTSGTFAGFSMKLNDSQHLRSVISDGTTETRKNDGTSPSAADSQWHYYTVVFDRTNDLSYLYRDGKQIGSTGDISLITGSVDNSNKLQIGHAAYGAYEGFLGYIDEVKIYQYARSAAQVQADFLKGAAKMGSSVVAGAQDTASLNNGLVGYWKMDESSLAGDCSTYDVIDSSGNGNNGTACPNGSSGSIDNGKFKNALTQTASNQRIEIPSNTSFTVGSGYSYTMAAWIYPTDVSSTHYIMYQSIGANMQISSGYMSTTITIPGVGAVSPVTNTSLQVNTWYHVAVTYNGNNNELRFYVNGKDDLNGPSTAQQAPTASTTIKLANNVTNAVGFTGKLDELRRYNRALSPQEIQDLYNWAPGPVGYWKMDEGNGSSALDSSGNSLTGTWQGTLGNQWTAGKFGKAGNFNGTDNSINVASNSLLSFERTDAFSVSAWVKTTSTTVRVIASKYTNSTTPNGWSLQANADEIGLQSSGKINVVIANDNSTNGIRVASTNTTNINDGEWHHYEMTYNGSSAASGVKLYEDGIALPLSTGQDTLTNTIVNSQDVGIGMRGGTVQYPFSGQIDNVKIYNYTRTPSQITEDMNAGHPIGGSPVGSQVAFWKFNEQQGTTVYSNTGCQHYRNYIWRSNMEYLHTV